MEPFSLTCTTCKTRLKVRDAAAIGKLLDCPKCGAFVLVEPPPTWNGVESECSTTVVAKKSSEDSASGESSSVMTLGPSAPPPPGETTFDDAASLFSNSPASSEPSFAAAPPRDEVPPVPLPAAVAQGDNDAPRAEPPVASVPTKSVAEPASVGFAEVPADSAGSSVSQWLLMGAAAVGGVALALMLFVLAIWMFAGDGSSVAVVAPTTENAHSADVVPPERATTPDKEAPKSDEPKNTTDPISGNAVATDPKPDTPSKPEVTDPVEPDPTGAAPDSLPTTTATKKPDPEVSIEPKTAPPVEPNTVADALKKFAPFLDDPSLRPSESPVESPAAKPETPTTLDVPEESARPRPEPRKINVAARLADKLPQVEFTGVSLVDFLQFATDLSTIPITLDPEALQSTGASADRGTVTLKLRDASVATMLKESLTPLGLALEPADVGLVVVRASPTDGKPRSVTYNVADLGGVDAAHLDLLAEWVRTLVLPESWDAAENPGVLEANLDKTALVVRNTEAAHFQMLLFCEKLRVSRGLAPKSKFDKSLFRLEPRVARSASQLAAPITLNYSQPAPLVKILDRLGKSAGVRILVDWQSVAIAGWTPDAEGTVSADKLPLGETLTALLAPMDLTYRVVDDGLLQVVSKATYDTRLELEFFDAADLLGEKPDADRLVDRIQAALGEDLFPVEGPGGAIRFDPLGRHLLVSLPQPKQAELARLLADWREAK